MSKPDLSVDLGKLKLKNPVLTASGTFGYGLEFVPYMDLERLGGIIVKGTTLYPRTGNPSPRIFETSAGMLNAIGLQNPGVDGFIRDILPETKKFNTNFIVNISGNTVDEYGILAKKLSIDGVAAIEVNISCPNVKAGGMEFGTDPYQAARVVKEVKKNTDLPVIVKLSPNVTSVVEIAIAVEDAGADIISLINTLLGMAIDIKKQKPHLGNTFGGLSGPAIKPVALRMVWQVYKNVSIPLIGMGGIVTVEDALEFIMAGAAAIAVGTGNFINPSASVDLVSDLEKYCVEHNVLKLSSLIGVAHKV
ncbi:MAG TPA: dihydroorotate dehydrogenase [Clostridiales bacterium]|nr:dihydroorotate dehydrogenase [Clostridia bacterium]MDD4680712.1 dihydroorotate dehydrogenase [Clostridia bacterium]HCS75793.1 dihydroorotate dehydrogenase [Clostridiales bacterium]